MDSFISALERELQPKIQGVLNSRYLTRLNEGTLPLEELRRFAVQYWCYCQYFPRFIAATAANVPDDQTRDSLVRNLWEEHGAGDLTRSHRALFLKFAAALNIEDALGHAEPLPSTSTLVQGMFALCQSAHFLEGIGALSIGCEFYTSEQYGRILSGLRYYSFLSEAALEFWSVHISMDVGHYDEMARSLSRWTDNEQWKDLIRRGAHRAVDLDLVFWEGLEKGLGTTNQDL